MFGLINSPKRDLNPGDVGALGAMIIALASISAVFYVIATAFTGGGSA